MSKRRPGSKHYAKLNRRRWLTIRQVVLKRDGHKCRNCGKPGKLEVHHIKPLQDGGLPYDPDNLLTICRSCHIDMHRQASETPGRQAWREFVNEILPL